MATSPIEVSIERLGSEGVGVARVDGAPVLVPDTLAGEYVRVLPAAAPTHSRLLQRLIESPDRIEPPCPHFSSCGSCTLQHLSQPLYTSFKRDLIVAALRRERLDGIEVAPVIVSPPHSRRRATLAILRRSGGVILGFHAKASRDIAAISTCAVLTPMLEALFEPIRAVMSKILEVGEQAEVSLTELDNGADLGLRLPGAPGLAQLELLLDFAESNDLARLWWRRGREVIRRSPSSIGVGPLSLLAALVCNRQWLGSFRRRATGQWP